MKNKETETATAEKPGFFKRMVNKLDTAMKEKAEAKAAEGCCCGPDSSDEDCCSPDPQVKRDSKCC
jgi:hypothetical protein